MGLCFCSNETTDCDSSNFIIDFISIANSIIETKFSVDA